MKVHIWKDERYTDYGIDAENNLNYEWVEISDELFEEYKAADAAYEAVQVKLANLYRSQVKAT